MLMSMKVPGLVPQYCESVVGIPGYWAEKRRVQPGKLRRRHSVKGTVPDAVPCIPWSRLTLNGFVAVLIYVFLHELTLDRR